MLFKLEAVRAKNGDSLILHYGQADKPRYILIDGGPGGVYQDALRKRLEQLKPADKPLPLQMVMVSHIDDDHINGVLQLVNELVKNAEDGDPDKPPLCRVLSLWHNSFEEITGGGQDAHFSSLTASVAAASAGGELVIPAGLGISTEGALLAASVPQGRKLRDQIKKLGVSVNKNFTGLVSAKKKKEDNIVQWGDGLELTVLGPKQLQLEELKETWQSTAASLKKNNASAAEAQAVAAAFTDDSVFNLSSIVVLAKGGGKTMLLTGDARGDFILDGLRSADLLKNDAIHVDLLKVPHHGSDRNVSTEFFRQVTANHYIISGDGKHGNPEKATLEMIADAREDDEFAIHLTYRKGDKNLAGKLKKFLDARDAQGRTFDVKIREETDLSIAVDLSTP